MKSEQIMNSLFASNPYYVKHEAQLTQLHHLMEKGKGDSEEADAVRDQMELSWWRLTEEEQDRVGGLSADLYMLSNEEVFEPLDRSKAQLASELESALCCERWTEALALLRKNADVVTTEQRAIVRARAYEALGHHDTALLFLTYAVSLIPHQLSALALAA